MRDSRFTVEQRGEIVLAFLSGKVSMVDLCREHQITNTTIYRWRDQFLEGALEGLRGKAGSEREADLDRENARLKQMIGELSLANYALKGGPTGSTRNKGGRV